MVMVQSSILICNASHVPGEGLDTLRPRTRSEEDEFSNVTKICVSVSEGKIIRFHHDPKIHMRREVADSYYEVQGVSEQNLVPSSEA